MYTLYPKVCNGSYSLINTVVQHIIDQSCEDIVDEHALAALDEMARDEQQSWVADGAFAMFTTILNQSEECIYSVERNLIMAKAHFHRSCLRRIPLLLYANDLRLRIQAPRRLPNAFSKRYCRVVSADSFFCVFYANKCSRKSSTTF